MANLTTNHDIICDALFMTGELLDITSSPNTSDYYNQAIVLLNRAHRAICSGSFELTPKIQHDWWWLRKSTPGVLTLQPAVNAGTVSVTKNNTAITFSTTPQINGVNVSCAGMIFSVTGGNGDVYRISSHTSGTTTAVLDSVYTDTTNAAAGYRAIQLIYTLASDVEQVLGPMRAFQPSETGNISGCSLEEMLSDYPLNRVTFGVPKRYAMVSEQRVQFSHYAGDNSELIRIEYDYKAMPTDLADDTNEPLLPRDHRRILTDYIQGYIFAAKSDDRAGAALASCKAGMEGMADVQINKMAGQGAIFGQIIPRQGQVRREVLRTTSGLVIG